MIDTVTLWSNIGSPVNQDYLCNIQEKIYTNTGELVIYATLSNMRVKITNEHISITGSLPKYIYGNNIQVLNRTDTKQALEQLSEELSHNINEFNVSRLDLANNLVLNYQVNSYLSSFGSLQYFKKDVYDKYSVLYRNAKRTVEFYDKSKERTSKKSELPAFLDGHNILRYEYQLKKQPKSILGLKELKASYLFDENFIKELSTIWKETYFKIEKNRTIKLNNEVIPMLSSKYLMKLLAAQGIEKIGFDNLLSMIDQEKAKFNEREFYRLKNAIKELVKEPALTEPNENILELDRKIIQVADHYR